MGAGSLAAPTGARATLASTKRWTTRFQPRPGVIVELGATPTRLTVGRGDRADLNLESDPEVSRLHAELELLDDDWIVADDGLSRNGSFVNGERVVGRRRLQDGDALRFGSTVVLFRTARP